MAGLPGALEAACPDMTSVLQTLQVSDLLLIFYHSVYYSYLLSECNPYRGYHYMTAVEP